MEKDVTDFLVIKDVVFWLIIGFVTLFLVVTLKVIRRSLADSNWKMSEAISELEGTPAAPAAPGEPAGEGQAMVTAAPGKPVMVASSSRLIALIGGIILAAMYLGTGYYMLFAVFYLPEDVKRIDEINQFFVMGMTLFSPYAVNKLSNMFKG
ncbi:MULTISPECIES: hypothetical protein [Yersiniaceae]|uniref:Uncharacterized protein n=2 Tax=Yersiniaceae TaxID=1903411 RepID=A0A2N5ESF3_9GAMM|nr:MULTISPECIES: hypothetical protein [Yersiniaceae]MBS0971395.1 hypothetical protein [Nissabacter archeti]PLR53032.1 hypothetical protein CYR34_00015 [Chimaeribacter arupi]